QQHGLGHAGRRGGRRLRAGRPAAGGYRRSDGKMAFVARRPRRERRGMNRAAFDFFSNLLRRESGMKITPEKSYLLESRLLPSAQARGAGNAEGLAAYMRRVPDDRAL